MDKFADVIEARQPITCPSCGHVCRVLHARVALHASAELLFEQIKHGRYILMGIHVPSMEYIAGIKDLASYEGRISINCPICNYKLL